MPIRVSRFRHIQLRRILAIEEAAFPGEAYSRRMFLDLECECGPLFYVARRGVRIVGYMVTCLERESAEIVSIAVHPEARGLGVGSALMRHTLSRLRRLGVSRLELMVRATNAAAIRFYRRFGFRRVRRVRGYYEDGGDGLCYRLDPVRIESATKPGATAPLRPGRGARDRCPDCPCPSSD
jgi:ribosomal-protein-alanine N-acetyltransferase